MALFSKKNLPEACPKCGKADSWRIVPAEIHQDYVNQAAAVNPFSPAPIRNTFSWNLTGRIGKKAAKLRYRCDHCGFEKNY